MGVVSVSGGRLLGVELPEAGGEPALPSAAGRRLRDPDAAEHGRRAADTADAASGGRGRRSCRGELGLGSGGLLPGRAAGLEGEGSASGGDGSGRLSSGGVSSSACRCLRRVTVSYGDSGRDGRLPPGGAGRRQRHGRQSHPRGGPLPSGGPLGWQSGQVRQRPAWKPRLLEHEGRRTWRRRRESRAGAWRERRQITCTSTVITGMSGAGKSEAVATFEDMGYFCIDNLPPQMLPGVVELFALEGSRVDRVALVFDVRGGKYFEYLGQASGLPARVGHLLQAALPGGLRRGAGRPLPVHPPTASAVAFESHRSPSSGSAACWPVSASEADLVIDTTDLSPRDLRRCIEETLLADELSDQMFREPGVVRIQVRPAGRGRHGPRRALSAQSALGREAATPDGHRRGRPGIRIADGPKAKPSSTRWRRCCASWRPGS